MTVGTTNVTNTFTGDGATTTFSFTFAAQVFADVQIFLGGVLQTTGYTLAINANADGSTGVGGTVTFTNAPAAGIAGVIARVTSLTQGVSMPVEGAFNEVVIGNALDKLTFGLQQLNAQLGLALSVPIQYSGIVNSSIGAPAPLYVARWNALGTAIEFVSPAQALLQAAPVPGGGTMVGPGTSTNYAPALFNGTTGQIVRDSGTLGAAGTVYTSNGPGNAPSWGTLQLPSLRSAGIFAAGRQLPTSGAISGTYWHYGNWASTGAITAAHGTKIYINGTFTLAHAITVSGSVSGGPANTLTGAPGLGLGGGQAAFYNVYPGGAGGGCGGAGGNGGSITANAFSSGGVAYKYTDFFSGSSGGGGGSASQPYTLGGTGGQAGGAIYIESTGSMTLSTGTITASGANGANGNTSPYSPGCGGGSGGVVVLRCGNTITLPLNSVYVNGGTGGNAFGAYGGNGGGGGGGIFDAAGVTLAINGSAIAATGGSAGTGGSAVQAAQAGSAGTNTQLATPYPVSAF